MTDKKLIVENELAQHLNIRDVKGEKIINTKMSQLCCQLAEEGIVLLENNGVLPLQKEDNIALFGRSQFDYFYVGYGSGGEVNPPYKINLVDGLKAENVMLNELLLDKYQKFIENHPIQDSLWGQWPRHLDEFELEDGLLKTVSQQSNVAVVVIGRAAGEDRENELEPGSYYLTETERSNLDRITNFFENIIIIINSGNIIDLSWLNNYKDKISALLLAWQGGMESGRALANILVGNANPSGKLPDTIAQKYDYYPSSNNFGQPEITEYVEDIYVGYRYFETFHPEQVLYPFGYGLSYSQFTVNSNASIQDDSILIKVQVENVGEVAGKEVVQVYYNPPQGKLGKSLRNLIRFDKTVELKPKESEELEFRINISEMASYDDSGATGNPYCYVLEPGQYDILVGTSLLDLKLVCTYDLKKIRVTEKLSQKAPAEYEFNRMFPKRVGNDLEVAFQKVPVRIENLKEKIIQNLPPKITIPNKDNLYLSTSKTIEELILSLTPTELDSLTRGEGKMDSPLGPKGNAGILGGTTDSLREKGIPPITTTDGPAGIRLNYYTALLPCGTALASSWNTALVEEMGKVFGAEMKALKTQVILAPGMNIHRNPLGGRNFEYFSEDPYLSGKMGAHYVLGVQSNRVAACPKHFVCNNQETNRNKNDSRVSERALREIYLKGFEICIKEAKPYSIMTSYNKINGVWAHYHYDLVTDILRNEWKYDGCVMTDWWMQLAQDPNFEHLTNNAYRLRAQVDILMPGGLSFTVKENDNSLIESLEKEEGITIEEVRRSAANILRFIEKIYA